MKHNRVVAGVLTAVTALALAATPAQADIPIVAVPDNVLLDLSTEMLMRRAWPGVLDPKAGPAQPTISTPELMASRLPRARRAESEKVFTNMLAAYHQLATRFKFSTSKAAGEAAAVLATFIVGNLAAYQGALCSDDQFTQVYKQFLAVTTKSIRAGEHTYNRAGFPTAHREELAILGMLMATSQMQLASRPDPKAQAALKKSAKEALTRMGLDPTKLQITDQGLTGAAGL